MMTRTIPYDPNVRALVVLSLIALPCGLMIILTAPAWSRFHLYCAYIGAGGWLVLTLRRLLWKRYLVLDDETISVPSGPLRLRTKRIVLRDIQRVWVVRAGPTNILCVRTSDSKLEIQDIFLPNGTVFRE